MRIFKYCDLEIISVILRGPLSGGQQVNLRKKN